MKPRSVVCLLLLSFTLFGQSNSASRISQPSTAAKPSRMLHGAAVGIGPNVSHATSRPAAPPQAGGLNFAPTVGYGSGGFGFVSVAVADLNGDGKADVVSANGCVSGTNGQCTDTTGAIAVLMGKGDGTFQASVTYDSGGKRTTSVAVADVNGDDKPDLLVTNYCADSNFPCDTSGSVGVLLGNGDGTFRTAVTYDSGGYMPASLAVADVNGDGEPDILVVNTCAGPPPQSGVCQSGSLSVLMGNGNGTFQAAVASPAGYYPGFVAAADVNGDGKTDLVLLAGFGGTSGGPNLGVLLGNGDGTFQTAITYYLVDATLESVAVADVNGDGKPDLLVTNYAGNENGTTVGEVDVLLGHGDGTFQEPVVYSTGGSDGGYGTYRIAVADLNGDGKPELVVQNYFSCSPSSNCPNTSEVSVLMGNGDGTFQPAVTFGPVGVSTGSVAVGDLNGDGRPDIVVGSICVSVSNCDNGVVGVLINTTPTTTTVLVSSPNPSNFDQSVSFTTTVTSQGFNVTPTGTVTFVDRSTSTTLGTSTLNTSGVATLQISTLGPSTHSIEAIYSGDTNFLSSTSPALSQVVLGAAAKLSPTSLIFGNQTVATSSSPQTVTLKNTGDIPLTFNSIKFTGTNPTNFHQTNNCGTSLAGGATCTFSVTFKPTAAGTRSAALTLSDNAPSKLQKIPVSGVGVLPAVTFSPTNLTFPTQVIYTTSKAQTVTLTNSGLGILSISNIVASAQFSQTNNCGSTVAPARTCTLTVKFQPTTLAAITGSISVTDNAAASPQALPLTGVGTAIQFTPVSLSFGNQPVGTKSLAKTVTVSNKSHITINISRIAIRGADPYDFPFISTTCGSSLASGASCFVKVAFMPAVTGKRTAWVAVSDDGGGEVQRAGLAGTGT